MPVKREKKSGEGMKVKKDEFLYDEQQLFLSQYQFTMMRG